MQNCQSPECAVKANEIIPLLFENKSMIPVALSATCFAPVNIALIKYWGKRNTELNLPVTNSLSIALPNKGTTTTVRINGLKHDRHFLGGELLSPNTEFSKRLSSFCGGFCPSNYFFDIDTHNNIPTAAGLASSASGFAALVLAFDQLFGWELDKTKLSILARLGSGSACRSLWNGFAEWQKGKRDDGLDSFASPIFIDNSNANDFLSTVRIGLLVFAKDKKIISSRQAMFNTVNTSLTYQYWPDQVEQDLREIKQAIIQQDFVAFGEISERNALAMHATMQDSQPKTDFCTEKTREYREKIWALRKAGIPIYFTQDAGPNLKLLFQENWQSTIIEAFSEVEIVVPFVGATCGRP